jgi:hypothetical protein
MNARYRLTALASLGCIALLAAACGGDDEAQLDATSTSTLRINLTDAPLTGVTKVWVQFTGVEVKPAGGPAEVFTFSPAKGFDLLTLTHGNAATLLGDTTVDAGNYEWIRLIPDTAPGALYVEVAGVRRGIRIPSGFETGLKLVRGFVMPAGGRADFTVDFDVARSLLAPPGQAPDVLMKPVLRIVDNLQVGTLVGSFSSGTLTAQAACTGVAPVVYVYPGSVTTPDDLFNPQDGSSDTMPNVDPLVTVIARPDAAGVYGYRIGFLPVGTYTVAFTCNADDPAIDEDTLVPDPIAFTLYPQPVSITVGATTTANF